MSKICLKCSEIYHDKVGKKCPKISCGDRISEIDIDILPHVLLLNRKGYDVWTSCSGYIDKPTKRMYISFNNMLFDPTIHKLSKHVEWQTSSITQKYSNLTSGKITMSEETFLEYRKSSILSRREILFKTLMSLYEVIEQWPAIIKNDDMICNHIIKKGDELIIDYLKTGASKIIKCLELQGFNIIHMHVNMDTKTMSMIINNNNNYVIRPNQYIVVNTVEKTILLKDRYEMVED